MAAVGIITAAMADVYPGSATGMLPDELVEREMAGDIVEPLTAGLYVGQVDVGGLAQAVLGAGYSAHCLVELAATVTAGDNDRHTSMLSQWFEHLLTEALQVGNGVGARFITYAEARSGGGASELLQHKMFRQLVTNHTYQNFKVNIHISADGILYQSAE